MTVRSPQVLVVDDDQDLLASLERGLRLAGFAVRLASDGAQALDAVGESRPDAVVLDVTMPHVEHHGVRRCLGHGVERLRSVAGGAHVEPRESQTAFQRRQQVPVVVDDQDLRRAGGHVPILHHAPILQHRVRSTREPPLTHAPVAVAGADPDGADGEVVGPRSSRRSRRRSRRS